MHIGVHVLCVNFENVQKSLQFQCVNFFKFEILRTVFESNCCGFELLLCIQVTVAYGIYTSGIIIAITYISLIENIHIQRLVGFVQISQSLLC